ncbi:MAG: glycosyltransferase family 39 protein [Theionarchaea archaeon]|nr:glycosyltransferase family 39 protein [Theionarchaea archaeon]
MEWKPLSHREYCALACICMLAFILVFQHAVQHEHPLSWDVWYHLRISRQVASGDLLWDAGSFGPEGRPHLYPPLFHVITAFLFRAGIPLETVARGMAPLVFTGTILALYLFVQSVWNRPTALAACFFASVSPALLDRGAAYTPESLSFIFLFCGFYFFFKHRWVISGVCGGLIILTHGITSITFFSVLLMAALCDMCIVKQSDWKGVIIICVVALIIGSPWLVRSFPVFIPRGFSYPLSYYPQRLGVIQVVLALLGGVFLSKDEKSLFIVAFAFPLLVLSQWSPSLPYRFVEFLVFPVCILAGIFIESMHLSYWKSCAVGVLFLMAFTQGFWSIEQYAPVVSEEEITAFTWAGSLSVSGYTIMSEGTAAPLIAYFSHTPPVKGAYQFGAPAITERNEDVRQFYTEYPDELFSTYNVFLVYYGAEERAYASVPPLDAVYATGNTAFFHR